MTVKGIPLGTALKLQASFLSSQGPFLSVLPMLSRRRVPDIRSKSMVGVIHDSNPGIVLCAQTRSTLSARLRIPYAHTASWTSFSIAAHNIMTQQPFHCCKIIPHSHTAKLSFLTPMWTSVQTLLLFTNRESGRGTGDALDSTQHEQGHRPHGADNGVQRK